MARIPRPRPIGATVIPHVLAGDMTLSQTAQGPVATSTYRVADVGGPALMRHLLAAEAPGIPRLGERHPVTAVPVSDVHTVLVEGCTSQFMVTVTWGKVSTSGDHFQNYPSESAPPTLELLSSVQSSTTMRDSDGNVITLDYIYDTGTSSEPGPTQTGTIEYMNLHQVVRYRRRERRRPSAKARKYLRHINSVALTLDGEHVDDPHTWLCTRLDSVTDDRGLSWNVTYDFTFSPETNGWDAEVVYIHRDTDMPVSNPVFTGEAPSAKVVQLYKVANFLDLNLTL